VVVTRLRCLLVGHRYEGVRHTYWAGLDDYDTYFTVTGPCRRCGHTKEGA